MKFSLNPKKHPFRSIRLKGYDYAQVGAYFITICGYRRKHWFGEIKNEKMFLNAFGRIAAKEWKSLPERFPQVKVEEYVIMPNHMHGILLVVAPLAGAFNEPITSIKDASRIHELNNDGESLERHLDVDPERHLDVDPECHLDVDPECHLDVDPECHLDVDPECHLDVDPDDFLDEHPQGVQLRGAQHLGEIVGAYKSLVADNCLELFKKHRPGKIMGKLWQRNYWEHIIRHEIAYNNIANYIINNPQNWKKDRFLPK